MRIVLIAVGLVLLVSASLLGGFAVRQRLPADAVAETLCSGPVDAAQRVLVLGDSWASKSNVDAAMARSARVCSVAYSGMTSQEALRSFMADRAAHATLLADLGNITDAVVLLGVNDANQHRGAGYYAEGIERVAGQLSTIARRVYVLELPPARIAPGVLAPALDIIDALFACLNDWCAEDVTATYRAAAAKLPITLIDYDRPDPELASYAPDGVHLTGEGYAALGRVIAAAVIGSR
jgi:lysophospholipase L1-like esterase